MRLPVCSSGQPVNDLLLRYRHNVRFIVVALAKFLLSQLVSSKVDLQNFEQLVGAEREDVLQGDSGRTFLKLCNAGKSAARFSFPKRHFNSPVRFPKNALANPKIYL